ncbi:hypothetical protein [Halioxenophilus sp. WMMB6]|uniref:hypothetical protein n=1 Tax=Halioxenophilus sp. WMMB6 TaxID=3073815 RepID=UPI00295E9018|nr:hypothetical protein [Halioxenophilus sp. WMMB6]
MTRRLSRKFSHCLCLLLLLSLATRAMAGGGCQHEATPIQDEQAAASHQQSAQDHCHHQAEDAAQPQPAKVAGSCCHGSCASGHCLGIFALPPAEPTAIEPLLFQFESTTAVALVSSPQSGLYHPPILL